MGKISELRTGQGNVEVEGEITEIGNTRAFNKYGRELKVADSILKDDSGAIKLSLWNDDIARFKEGDRIKIINGYVSEFQGEKQLTSGKFGRMEKVIDKKGSEEKGNDKKEIREEIDKELTDSEAKSKKASVSKKKAKDEESSLIKTSEKKDREEATETDEYEGNIEEMPEEENMK